MNKKQILIPRGLRNNNPLNIRRSKTWWVGSTEKPKDRSFVTFTEMRWGWRAAFKLLAIYYHKHKLTTIQGIITRWAPPQDHNNTKGYINRVCAFTQLQPTTQLLPPIEDPKTWKEIGYAMATVENGTADIDLLPLHDGYRLWANEQGK